QFTVYGPERNESGRVRGPPQRRLGPAGGPAEARPARPPRRPPTRRRPDPGQPLSPGHRRPGPRPPRLAGRACHLLPEPARGAGLLGRLPPKRKRRPATGRLLPGDPAPD